MILLDGVYAVIGIVLSWLLLKASGIAQQGPTRNFPYGREAATPLVIGIQGFVLAATLVYAAVEAVNTIRLGGSDFTPGWAIVYGVLTTLGSVVTWRWIHSMTGDSDLLVAESTAWRIGALRGAGMVVGFSIMAVLVGSSWEDAAPYVDPVMVLVTCVAFMPSPLRMMRTTIIELLEGSPPADIRADVHECVVAVRSQFGLDDVVVRTTKVGPKLYVELDGVVDGDVTVRQEHEIRRALNARLDELPYEIWLNLELTPRTDPA
jgi:predicted Co/Zn/Cd cation transporter (cation efflux family)